MKLFNTLSRKLEDFKPLKDNLVTVYSCGPTVYDHIHIGNLSSFIYADTLHRVLESSGLKVKHVMNITDVDDKTIARSASEYPDDDSLVALKQLTKKYTDLFLEDMRDVGVNTNQINFVNATDSIKAMQTLIRELYKNNFAYITDDGVYFSIKAYKDSGKKYGQLTNITVDSTSQARIRNDEYDKESAHDFALWKQKTGNEPSWEFELDGHQLSGRPGWHIECSSMSSQALGQPFDIHTGGVDLIFPHNENEIAQSTASKNDDIMAKLFFHNEHMLVDGHKMSKSLNNFYTLRDIKEKGIDPLAFRLMVMQSHYRNQSNFTWENLVAAQNRLKHWQQVANLKWQQNFKDKIDFGIKEAAQSDLDTPTVLKLVDDYITEFENGETNYDLSTLLSQINELLGINLTSTDITNEQKQLIKKRQQAREDKDWHKSDEIRNQLQQQNIGVRDTDRSTIWYRL